jgi:uncharacterized protein
MASDVTYYNIPLSEYCSNTDEVTEQILEDHRPEKIVGILKGGYVFARFVADSLGMNLVIPFGLRTYDENFHKLDKPEIYVDVREEDIEGKDVLVIDDISDTGETLAFTDEHLRDKNPRELRTATMHVREGSIFIPEYYVKNDIGEKYIAFLGEKAETIRRGIRKGNRRALEEVFTLREIETVLYHDSL